MVEAIRQWELVVPRDGRLDVTADLQRKSLRLTETRITGAEYAKDAWRDEHVGALLISELCMEATNSAPQWRRAYSCCDISLHRPLVRTIGGHERACVDVPPADLACRRTDRQGRQSGPKEAMGRGGAVWPQVCWELASPCAELKGGVTGTLLVPRLCKTAYIYRRWAA